MNYFDLVETIKTVSLRYSQEFYEGDVYEFLNSGNHKYPSVILTVQNITTDDNINSVSATLFCVDRLTDNADNKLEIQSLCMTNLSKIIDSLEDKITNLTANTYTPFTEKFADLCGGMFVEFSFQYVGESLCDDLEIKEIELTQNGIYDVIGYDRAIVNVRPVVNLEDITITDNGEYTPSEGFDGFGKVNVDLKRIIQVRSFRVSQDSIINGKWIYENLFDFSDGLIELTNAFSTYPKVSKIVEIPTLNSWNVSNVTILATMFDECRNIKFLDFEDWDVSKVNNYQGMFRACTSLEKVNITKWNVLPTANLVNMFSTCLKLYSLVGDYTIDEVISNNITIFNGYKNSLDCFPSSNNINRASLRALINGLADLSDTTTKTLKLGATLRAKLTEEDIEIATNKNWTIA